MVLLVENSSAILLFIISKITTVYTAWWYVSCFVGFESNESNHISDFDVTMFFLLQGNSI